MLHWVIDGASPPPSGPPAPPIGSFFRVCVCVGEWRLQSNLWPTPSASICLIYGCYWKIRSAAFNYEARCRAKKKENEQTNKGKNKIFILKKQTAGNRRRQPIEMMMMAPLTANPFGKQTNWKPGKSEPEIMRLQRKGCRKYPKTMSAEISVYFLFHVFILLYFFWLPVCLLRGAVCVLICRKWRGHKKATSPEKEQAKNIKKNGSRGFAGAGAGDKTSYMAKHAPLHKGGGQGRGMGWCRVTCMAQVF